MVFDVARFFLWLQFRSFSERIANIRIDVSHKVHESNDQEVEVSHPTVIMDVLALIVILGNLF